LIVRDFCYVVFFLFFFLFNYWIIK
jgi:hypothetical protein